MISLIVAALVAVMITRPATALQLSVLPATDQGYSRYFVHHSKHNSPQPWMESAPPALHCNGHWFSADEQDVQRGSLPLVLNISTTISGESDSNGFGAYTGVQDTFFMNNEPSKRFITVIKQYLANTIVVFEQQFPDGCKEANVSQPQSPLREFNSSSIALSEFPSFVYSSASFQTQGLSHITWTGRFSHDKSTHNLTLDQFQGGSEGGPLLLFDSTVTTWTSALVFSPLQGIMEGILNLRYPFHESNASAKAIPSRSISNPQLLENCDENGWIFDNNTDYEGHDLYSLTNITSASDCARQCQNEPACGYFSWIYPQDKQYGNMCFLKYSAQGAIVNEGHISGRLCTRHLVFGIQGKITQVPARHIQSFIMVLGQNSGINGGMQLWGQAMKTAYNTSRMTPDVVTTKLGYWTDNGGYFYGGNPLNQASAFAVLGNLSQQGVPIKYLQLDPFWYPVETETCASGARSWVPRLDLFPSGLEPLISTEGGEPLLLYSSYFCPDSADYYPDFNFTFVASQYFDVGFARGVISHIDASESYDFYLTLMSNYSSVMSSFEVDFMDFNYLTFTDFTEQVGVFDTWAAGMADAAFELRLPIQYCMALPNEILNSVKYPAVTNARASEDNFPSNEDRWQIAYTSLFYAAVDVKPFMDVIWTRSDQPNNPYGISRDNIELQAIVATLSKGPLGIGDAPGHTNASLVQRMTRMSTGDVLHPSYSATPLDKMYYPQLDNSGHELWQAHSVVSNVTTYTLLAVDTPSPGISMQLDELWPPAMAAEYCVYRDGSACITFATCVTLVDRSTSLTAVTPPPQGTEHGFSLFTLSPVLWNGWCLIGDTSAFVTTSPQRVLSIETTSTSLVVMTACGPNDGGDLLAIDARQQTIHQLSSPCAQGVATFVFQRKSL
eukprot:m.105214 g.105214  ORF g.105214 m.105214 type:complete len:897 (+) comp15104_c1_seq7:127-2817(+)